MGNIVNFFTTQIIMFTHLHTECLIIQEKVHSIFKLFLPYGSFWFVLEFILTKLEINTMFYILSYVILFAFFPLILFMSFFIKFIWVTLVHKIT